MKNDRDLINLRDQAAGIERNVELLLQDAQFGLDFTQVKQAEEQASSARRMAATAHRPTCSRPYFCRSPALTGLFSMNVRSPVSDTTGNSWLIALAGVVVGLLISTLVIGRRS